MKILELGSQRNGQPGEMAAVRYIFTHANNSRLGEIETQLSCLLLDLLRYYSCFSAIISSMDSMHIDRISFMTVFIREKKNQFGNKLGGV